MKAGWSIAILLALVCCSSRTTPDTSAVKTTVVEKRVEEKRVEQKKEVVVVDTFQPVKDMLGRTCAPCHNPGGKMYATLPFDQPEVIQAHSDAIHQRLSPENKGILEAWLKKQPVEKEIPVEK